MTKQERVDIEAKFEEFVDPSLKLRTFHNYETGEVIMIVFNPNILGITHLKDFLTLKADHLRNLVFWFRTRNPKKLELMLKVWRNKKLTPYPIQTAQGPIENQGITLDGVVYEGGLKPEVLPLQPTQQ